MLINTDQESTKGEAMIRNAPHTASEAVALPTPDRFRLIAEELEALNPQNPRYRALLDAYMLFGGFTDERAALGDAQHRLTP